MDYTPTKCLNNQKKILKEKADKNLLKKNGKIDKNETIRTKFRKYKIKIRKKNLSNQSYFSIKNFLYSLLKLYLSMNLIISISSHFNHISIRKLPSSFSEITMDIIGEIGEQMVINSENVLCPDEIYVNENKIAEGNCLINLNNEGNITIKMIWNTQLSTCKGMFEGFTNIINIDLSKFDSSLVTDMSDMFYECNTLKSIKFGNFNTSLVATMRGLFTRCKSLESLDLSSFNTKLVVDMYAMFCSCESLKILIISNFDTSSVNTMHSLFEFCKSLTSLDLSNFDTSLVTDMGYMFNFCKSLTSLDLSNFNTHLVTTMQDMFFACDSLVILDLSNFNTQLVTIMDYMFSNCKSLVSLYLSSFDTSKVSDMQFMFNQCSSLKSLDLSNFDTSLVTSMVQMFYGCKSLTSLNIGKFKTTKVQKMLAMFYGCSSLTSLDVSSFDTSLVKDLGSMFGECKLITSLNLTGFNTSKADSIDKMFDGCSSLKEINLSSFNTSLVEDMGDLFAGCSSLTSLDLSNFDTSLAKYMWSMFEGCSSLTFLNLSNFNTISTQYMRYMFYGCSSLTSLDLSNFDTSSAVWMQGMFYNCSSLKYLNLQKFNTSLINELDDMFNGCSSLIYVNISNFVTENVESMKGMFSGCSSLVSLNISNFDISKVSNMNKMFLNCKNLKYINMENANELNNLNTENMFDYINNNIIYCINEEKAPKIYELLQNIKYSKKDCSINWENNINLTEVCSFNLENIINSTEVYIFENSCSTPEFFEGKCAINNSNVEKREIIGQKIIDDIMDGSMDPIINNIIDYNLSYTIKSENQVYQISSISYQKENFHNNSMTIVDLGECEKILKLGNGLDINEELIILKIDNYLPGFNIPIIEYVIFNKNGKIKLNLSYCDEVPIQYYIPVSINSSDIYKYDSKSDFYNDGCYPYTSQYKTDITLYDRKNEYNKNNLSLCEKNCELKGYNSETSKVECECKIKNDINFWSDIHIDKNKLIEQLINIKKISNILVIKCYKLLFSSKGLISNIGSYTLLTLIFINIICSILFFKIGYSLLLNKIKKIIEIKFNIPLEIKKTNIPPKRKGKKKRSSIRSKAKVDIMDENINYQTNNYIKEKEEINDKIEDKDGDKNNKMNIDLNDYELNSSSYEDAIKYDHRTYFEYYLSLIRTKHMIIFTFYTYNDYNPRIIKISLFFFSFGLFYIVNALFFNDSTMHQIYEDHGVFNFIFQIPQIIYSTIISVVIRTILSLLSSSEKNIIEIKNQKTLEEAKNTAKKKQKCLLIKFILFFIISFSFLAFSWYYISCFCAVFKNTQLYLIKDTAISFGTSLFYPFVINLIPGFFRIHSLKNGKKKCLYRISKIIQLI